MPIVGAASPPGGLDVMAKKGAAGMPIDVLIDATVAGALCLLAANVGSFLNVVAYRVPRGASVAWGGSRCPACESPIRWYDNVPVVGWLALGGRCRDCDAAIPPRYPLVEAAAGGIGLLATVELLSGGRTWPTGRFGIGRTGADVLLLAADWPLVLVCVAHFSLLFLLLAWTLFEVDRTRIAPRSFFAVAAVLAAIAVVAGGPTTAPGWPAVGAAAAGAGLGSLLGTTAASPWLQQAFVFVGTVLGWQAVVGAGAFMAAVAVGRWAVAAWRGCRCPLEPTCGDLFVATAVQALAWPFFPT